MGRKLRWEREGNDLRNLRDCTGMSQNVMAREIGIGRSTLSGYERGAHKVPDDVAYDVCQEYVKGNTGVDLNTYYPYPVATARMQNILSEAIKSPLFRDVKEKPKEPLEIKLGDGKVGISVIKNQETNVLGVVFRLVKQREIGSRPPEEEAYDPEKTEAIIKITKPESAQVLIDAVSEARDELIRRETVNVDEVTDKALIALLKYSMLDGTLPPTQDVIDQGWSLQNAKDVAGIVELSCYYSSFIASLLDKDQDGVNNTLRLMKERGYKIGYNPKK